MTECRPGSRESAAIMIDGPALRELRKERGLSIAQVATRVGVGKAYISKLELGHSKRCSPTVHAALVRVLRPIDHHAFRVAAAG
jgi:predicted transcriptional regulator